MNTDYEKLSALESVLKQKQYIVGAINKQIAQVAILKDCLSFACPYEPCVILYTKYYLK